MCEAIHAASIVSGSDAAYCICPPRFFYKISNYILLMPHLTAQIIVFVIRIQEFNIS